MRHLFLVLALVLMMSVLGGTAFAGWVAISLHPAGATNSYARSVSSGQQVGYTYTNGIPRASLWRGTAATWVDLGAFLPSGYASSYARSILVTSEGTWVVGNAKNTATGQVEAMLWYNPVPEPASYIGLSTGLLGLLGMFKSRRNEG